MDVEEEDSSLVCGAGRAEDGGHPLVQVVTLGPRAAVGRRVEGDLAELLLDPLGRGAEGLGQLGRRPLLLRLLW